MTFDGTCERGGFQRAPQEIEESPPGGPTWPLGRWVRWPVTPTGTGAGSSAPPPYRRLPAGAEAARVLGS